jgi:hypothetical protein
MKTLSSEPEMIAMANALRLGDGDPVANIINFCRNKIAEWIKQSGHAIRSAWDLEKLVCEKLNLVIEHVWNDDDLDKLIQQYLEEGDFVFAHLKKDMDEHTFATLIRRKATNSKAKDSYVAVIDCRGEKGPRRVFSRWHEIAHILTLYKQMELPFHRSTVEKNATEKMMDVIAGDICFYRPLFFPVLQAKIESFGRLSFDSVESVREEFYPEASFQATLNACAAQVQAPVVLLEIGMALKKTEQRRLQSPQIELIPIEPPKPRLRVVNSMANAAARRISLQVPRYMRVPSRSILAKVFKGDVDVVTQPAEADENLAWWTSSDGGALAPMQVNIQAIKIRDHVFAIISPTGARWN